MNELQLDLHFIECQRILYVCVDYRFGTQQGKKDFKVLVFHFIEGQIVAFLSMMLMCFDHLILLTIGMRSFSTKYFFLLSVFLSSFVAVLTHY